MRTARLLTVCPGSVYQGVSAQGGVSAYGVSVRGAVCLGVGVSAQGVVCHPQTRGRQSPPPWTDRHLWKHNLRKLRLRAVISIYLSSVNHELSILTMRRDGQKRGCVCSQGGVCSGGSALEVSAPGGGGGGCLLQGVVSQHALRQTPSHLWTEWMTDRCKNITLATTSLQPVKICI